MFAPAASVPAPSVRQQGRAVAGLGPVLIVTSDRRPVAGLSGAPPPSAAFFFCANRRGRPRHRLTGHWSLVTGHWSLVTDPKPWRAGCCTSGPPAAPLPVPRATASPSRGV